MPLLWFALPSCMKNSAQALSIWKVLDIVYIGEIAGVLMLLGAMNFYSLYSAADSRSKGS